MRELEGRVAVITGGASGIGRALADRFGAAGMRLAVADVEPAALDAAVADLRAAGTETIGRVCDVSDAAQVEAFAAETFDHYGTAHLVCNNAGVGGTPGTTWESDPAGWEWTLGVNLMGVVHGIRAFVPHLVEQREGHVVNTASLAGLKGAPFMAAYVAAKHAVVGISESLALEFDMIDHRLGVSVLCPGFVRTRIAESGRNWPDRLGANPTAVAGSPAGDFVRGLVAGGIDPAAYAVMVEDAVRDNRFYVLSDPAHADAIMARYREASGGEAPAPPPI